MQTHTHTKPAPKPTPIRPSIHTHTHTHTHTHNRTTTQYEGQTNRRQPATYHQPTHNPPSTTSFQPSPKILAYPNLSYLTPLHPIPSQHNHITSQPQNHSTFKNHKVTPPPSSSWLPPPPPLSLSLSQSHAADYIEHIQVCVFVLRVYVCVVCVYMCCVILYCVIYVTVGKLPKVGR